MYFSALDEERMLLRIEHREMDENGSWVRKYHSALDEKRILLSIEHRRPDKIWSLMSR